MHEPLWELAEGGNYVVSACYVGADLVGFVSLIPGAGIFYGCTLAGVISAPLPSVRAAMDYVETCIPRRAAA